MAKLSNLLIYSALMNEAPSRNSDFADFGPERPIERLQMQDANPPQRIFTIQGVKVLAATKKMAKMIYSRMKNK